jgi:hypothetical protein
MLVILPAFAFDALPAKIAPLGSALLSASPGDAGLASDPTICRGARLRGPPVSLPDQVAGNLSRRDGAKSTTRRVQSL